MHRVFAFLLCFSCSVLLSFAKSLSPNDMGYKKAKNDRERYEILYNTHVKACALGVSVDYSGLGMVNIEVTKESQPMPVLSSQDFSNVTIKVTNRVKDIFLFTLERKALPVDVKKKQIDARNFGKHPKLCKGDYLLLIEDTNPWVDNRKGYNYSHKRKDLLVIHNGKALNSSIMPYDNDFSSPKCSYIGMSDTKTIIENLKFIRSKDSNYKTRLISISGVNDLLIRNITTETPANTNLSGDAIFSITGCANLYFEDVFINGTYSLKDRFGYGISLGNVYNAHFVRLKGDGNWGIFGNNNVNKAYLENCDINRFDVHCYAKDITLYQCLIRNLFNRFSSVYGDVIFNNCTFYKSAPLVLDVSYNAYTPFDLTMKDCTLYPTSNHNYLVYAGQIEDTPNNRHELKDIAWPNINISNLHIVVPEDVNRIYLFKAVNNNKNAIIHNLKRINISGLKIENEKGRSDVDFYLSNISVLINETFNCSIKGNIKKTQIKNSIRSKKGKDKIKMN